jgi:hypothetical protein
MRGLILALLLTLGGTVAQGHHSIAAMYDRDRPVKLDAIIVEFALVQPHPFLVVDVKDSNGSARWRGEMDNRHELVSLGIKADTFRPGDRVIVSGTTGRTQPRTLYIWRLDRPADGFWYEQIGMSPRIGFNRAG